MILNTDDREILEQIAKGIYEKINSTQDSSGKLKIISAMRSRRPKNRGLPVPSELQAQGM